MMSGAAGMEWLMHADWPWLEVAPPESGASRSLPFLADAELGRHATVSRQQRQLPERILVTVHQACDLLDLDVAGSLLQILEVVLLQPQPGLNQVSRSSSKRVIEGMIAAHARLWHLRHAGEIEPRGIASVAEALAVPIPVMAPSIGAPPGI